jgi:tRNA (cytidine/uridine-2'-O-)-methyltransferase
LNVVLYQPEIPQNTGNIGRTCVALGAKLWIVQPSAFRLDASHLKRAGLDYWQHLSWESVANWEILLERLTDSQFWLVTKFATRNYWQADFTPGCTLVIGRESNGLPEWLHASFPDRCIGIPMPGPVRSLNQSTAAAIVMYQAARTIGVV